MKKYVTAAEEVDLRTMSDRDFLKYVCAELTSRDIDTTLHTYELKAKEYGSGDTYTVKFKCPGDYLAYYAMSAHEDIRTLDGLAEAVSDRIGDYIKNNVVDFDEYFADYNGASIEGMYEYASDYWWGDGSDYIIHLKNLDTNTTLYEGDDEVDYDEDDEDWDSWED